MATENGGSGTDTIIGASANDSLSGNGGNDSLVGNGGNDTLRGGTDHDSIDGGTGDDHLYGDEGNDSISGGDGYDQIYGGDGDDTISGDGNYDDIRAGSGNDSVSGGTGDDWIWGEDGDDTISGDEGNDSIFGGAGNDSIDGGVGSDTIHGESGNDSIEGGDGNDSIYGDGGSDTLKGGSGQDWIDGGDGDDSISGGSDSDTVVGGRGADTIKGDDGDDIVSGHAGDDALYGGAGNDSLYGGSGDDYFDGGTGDDRIYMSRDAGSGTYTNVGSESDTDVVRLHAGSGHDVAYDFQGEDDYIYIGSIPESDIIFTQTGPSTWVLTQAGGSSSDSLTINFAPGTEPDSEGDLRNQLVTDDEYTPPGNGNGSTLNPACFTAKSRILTPTGLTSIGDLAPGDLVMTADCGPQPILDVLTTRFESTDLTRFKSLRPVVIEAGGFGNGLPLSKMHISRQHAFAIDRGKTLVRAVHLAEHFGLARIQNNRPNAIEYIHLLLQDHHLVQVEGVWTESFYSASHGSMADILASSPDIVHVSRCRPLLSRANLRDATPRADGIGCVDCQPPPSILGEIATASAPFCVSP
ncbi:MAG: Hint domain-containing protein [Sulfitobacter sp.]